MAAQPAENAAAYPSRPVRVIVPYSPGGSSDAVARVLSAKLAESLGQQFVIDNRPGAAGSLGREIVAKSAPDGYTLLIGDSPHTINTHVLKHVPYDPIRDFTPISLIATAPQVLVVHPGVAAKSVKELVAAAQAQPGKLNYGSGGNGTNTHLGGELFKSLAGVDVVHIPYKGAGAVLADLLSGQVQMLISAVATTLPHIKSGKLRALMVTDDRRAGALPDVPSAPEAGLPKMVMLFWAGYAVPAGTPAPIVERLHREFVAALASAETKKRFGDLSLDAVGNTPAQAAKLLDEEIQRWGAVIKAANIKAE